MKRYLFLILAACLVACQNDLNLNNESPTTRAIVDESNSSISNPNLLSNWENIQTITLNTIGTPTQNRKVTSPWSDGVSTQLSDKFRKDIKQENGWKMLFHTFKEVGLDEKQNYMCFYNIFTGYLKFFYYYEGEQKSQGTQWYIRTSNGQNTKLFNLIDYIAKIDTAKCEHNSILLSNLTGNPTNGITPGWNGFEFEVPYCTDYRNIDLVIGAYDRNITSYNFLGKEEALIAGTTTGTNTSSSTTTTSTTTIEGEDAKKYIEKLDQKAELGSQMDSLITDALSGGKPASAITSGGNKAFGRATTITTTTTTSSSTTEENIKLTTSGSITMSGTGTSEVTTGIPPLTFNLYRTMNPAPKQAASTSSSFVYATNSTSTEEHYIGVWTLFHAPVIIYPRFTTVRHISWNIGAYSPYPDRKQVSGTTSTPKMYPHGCMKNINPDIEQYIISTKGKAELVRCDTLNGMIYKKGVKDFGASYLKPNLVYRDQDRCFYEVDITRQVPCIGYASPTTSAQDYHYDWGTILSGRVLGVYSVENTYSYRGKKITVYQSRVYEPTYDFDVIHIEDYEGYKDAMLNYKQPAFGIHIEEKDLYLYGK